MKTKEREAFQQRVFDQLDELGRPTLRAALAAELTFYSNQANPPALHTLAKNYLDLLGQSLHPPLPTRKHLAFRDDRQVKVLSVSYHLSPSPRTPAIHVELGRLSDLRQDLLLLDRIRHGDFERDEDEWPRRYSSDFSPSTRNEERAVEYLDESFDSYREVMSETWARGLDPDIVALMREMEQETLQERYLTWNELVVRRAVLRLLRNRQSTRRAAIDEAAGAPQRQLLLSAPMSLDLTHAPTVAGDSDRFQRDVAAALGGFASRMRWLFPLRVPLSAIILAVPPPNGIDLDNLARRIVPLIHTHWEPPRSRLRNIDLTRVDNAYIREQLGAQIAAERRFPPTSLTRYEVIELPRRPADSPSGFVRVALGFGGDLTTIRGTIDEQIDEWLDTTS